MTGFIIFGSGLIAGAGIAASLVWVLGRERAIWLESEVDRLSRQAELLADQLSNAREALRVNEVE